MTQNKNMKKDKRELIGNLFGLIENLRPEYLAKIKRKHPRIALVEIYKDKEFGAVAEIYERNDMFERVKERISKEDMKKIHKSLSDIKSNDKPVDTSKWVKPNEESIRNELIECLFYLELFKEKDNLLWREYFGKAKAYYAVLNSHAPKNPQTLGNYSIEPYFESIMQEGNSPIYKKHIKEFFECKDVAKYPMDYQTWKEKCLSNMIKRDINPPKFKDIFKEIKLKLKDEIN